MRLPPSLVIVAIILSVVFSSSLSLGAKVNAGPSPFTSDDLKKMYLRFRNNIDYHNTGANMASPSTEYPDYFYDWVRDSAITTPIAALLQKVRKKE